MASTNPQPWCSEQSWQRVAEQEAEDIANAIAASLDTAQMTRPHALSDGNWTPRTIDECRTYQRQENALKETNESKLYPDYHKAIAFSLNEVKYLNEAPASTAEISTASVENIAALPTSRSTTAESAMSTTNRTTITKSSTAPPSSTISKPATIDDLIMDMQAQIPLPASPLNQVDGDTLVFIDPPPQQPEQDDASYKHYRERFRAPMLMKSSILLGHQSPFFEKALGPTAQYRALRRRALGGKLHPPIKYVLDLTPATEGEEIVHLLSEMCLPEGVKRWAIAGKLWPISKIVIGGEEEYIKKATSSEAMESTSGGSTHDSRNSEKDLNLVYKRQEEAMRLPPDYSPLVHRSAIIRVLQAMSGIDPGLDSAAKVWTTCVIASSYDIHSSELRDYVVSWLYRSSYFLEVLPEVSLRIAEMLKCHDLCRNAFAILVAEEAFESNCRANAKYAKVTKYGRKREDLPEDHQTRIEYASKAFIDRVTSEFNKIARVDWLDHIHEYRKLLDTKFEPKEGELPTLFQAKIGSIKNLLKNYIRGAIYAVLCASYSVEDTGDRGQWDYSKTNGLFPVKNANDQTILWNSLLPNERVFTDSFWRNLGCRGSCNRYTKIVFQRGLNPAPISQSSIFERHLRNCRVYEQVTIRDLEIALLELRLYYPPTGCEVNDDTSSTSSSDDSTGQAEDPKSMDDTLYWGSYTHSENFNLLHFLLEVEEYLKTVSARMTSYTESDFRKDSDHTPLLDILGCLQDSEWKFLPLWAGGCDDGSGGVYDDDLPLASAGFSQPGPVVHMGPDSIAGSSEFSFISGRNTDNTSTKTNDSRESSSSTDLDSKFQRITIHPNGYAQDASSIQDVSELGDSEYDFGSVTSTGDDASASQEATAAQLNQSPHPLAKAPGNQALRDHVEPTAAIDIPAHPQHEEVEPSDATEGNTEQMTEEELDSIFLGSDDMEEGYDSDSTIADFRDDLSEY